MASDKKPSTYSEVIGKALDKLRPKIVSEITKQNHFFDYYKTMQNTPNKWGLKPMACDKCEHSIHFSLCGTNGCKCLSTEIPKQPSVALQQAIDHAAAQNAGKQKYSVYNRDGYEIQTIYLPYPPANHIRVVHAAEKATLTYFRYDDDGGMSFYAETGTPVTTIKKISGYKNQKYIEALAGEKLKMTAKLQMYDLNELKELASKAHADKVAKKLHELEKKIEAQEEEKKLEQQFQILSIQTSNPYYNSYTKWQQNLPQPYQQPYVGSGVGLTEPPTVEPPKPKPEPEPEIVGEKKRRMIAITIERIDDEPAGNEGQPVGDPAQEEGAGGEGREGKSGEAASAVSPANGT